MRRRFQKLANMFTSLQIAIHGAGAASRSVVGRGAAGTSQPAGSALGSEWKAERVNIIINETVLL